MSQSLEACFRKHAPATPPDLLDRTMAQINRLERRRFFVRRLVAPFLGLIASAAAAAYAVLAAVGGLANSGVGEFFRTAATDWQGALVVWQDLLLSVVESLPLVRLAVAFAALGLFMWMMRRLSRSLGPIAHLKGI